MDFKGIVVKKPWGFETPLFDNGTVAVWYLRINEGQSTSLHAHRNKRTAMILLNGTAMAEYLSDCRYMHALDKTAYGPRFFHRTHALTDCDLLEVETPVDKLDVHRFKDNYGREGKAYEGADSYRPLADGDPKMVSGSVTIGNAHVTYRTADLYLDEMRERLTELADQCAMLIFMRGSLWSPQGVDVVVPGHVVWSKHMGELLSMTEPECSIELMQVWKDEF